MSITEIKSLLQGIIGLNANTVGASNFERAVRHRMKICEISEVNEYLSELENSEYEVKELIEEVVIPETWFFRNQQSFIAFDSYIKDEWLVNNKEKKLKILSAPSSTGEEPYSIVMSLDKHGLGGDYFQLDAIDISTRLLSKAKRGVYGKHSFRNKENNFIDAYFDRIDDTFVLHEDIRTSVNFKQGNILEENLGNGTAIKYDIIFCRNLLIYFDRSTQEKAIENLCKFLNDDGVMFLGHAETGEYINKHLTRAKYARAFAYHRVPKENTKSKKEGALSKDKLDHKKSKIGQKTTQTAFKKLLSSAPTGEKSLHFLETMEINLLDNNPPKNDKILRKVKQLADAGELKEASALCESYLQTHDASAQAYYLLGLIRESEGKQKLVGELFRKAVYLDPNHHAAMIHLALHAGRQGDADMAKKLHQRAQRVVKRNKS